MLSIKHDLQLLRDARDRYKAEIERLERENANLKAEMLELYSGGRVILPANADHARAMAGIADAYLKRA